MRELDSSPLIAAVPKPPQPKGEWSYRQWYVARKTGRVSLSVALRMLDIAGVPYERVYPQLKSIELDCDDEGIYRNCSRCGANFLALPRGRRGAPKTKCGDCRITGVCFVCSAPFQSTRKRKYCGEICRDEARRRSQRRRIRSNRLEKVRRDCQTCSAQYVCSARSRSRYCPNCRVVSADDGAAISGYESPYPMCAGCGGDKTAGRATCGSELCRTLHRGAKAAAQTYKVLPENVMVLRSCPRCDACGQKFTDEVTQCIDHCHDTGRIRGVLCRECNSALGFAKESPERLVALADYIRING